jgi:3D (Asp-Asp-Asp) domain-containing protein
MEVTAYDLSYESCGKLPNHPEYGITASGEPVKEWYTVAAGKELKFGTRVYIPYFADKPNGGVFVVQDRGGGVGNGQLDVYIEDNASCMEFGRRKLEVWVIE